MATLLLVVSVALAGPLAMPSTLCLTIPCTCPPPKPFPDAVPGAAAVVEAVAGPQRPYGLRNRARVSTVTRVQVLRVWKGDVPDTFYVFTGSGGGDCGFQFTEGVHYILFLYREPEGRLTTSICTPSIPSSVADSRIAELGPPQRIAEGGAASPP